MSMWESVSWESCELALACSRKEDSPDRPSLLAGVSPRYNELSMLSFVLSVHGWSWGVTQIPCDQRELGWVLDPKPSP